MNWFGFLGSSSSDESLPKTFALAITEADFVKTDVISIYSKILTDVVERTHGLTDDQQFLLWDNCLKSESSAGLITLLAEAMADKADLFLVIDAGVLRKADMKEKAQIEADYKARAGSDAGIYISFRNYRRTDMVKLYSGFEYCAVGSLNKTMNLSKALQFKMNDMRASTSLNGSEAVVTQAKNIAKQLGDGKDVLLDGKDEIVTAAPDMSATKESVGFLNQKRAFYLGMPESYITGEQTGGIGSSGENDTKAVERGLKNYYFAIVKPTFEALFKGAKLTYKSQDFRQITQGLEALKTFALIDDAILSIDDQKKLVNQLFDFDTAGGSDDQSPAKKPAAAAPAPKVEP